MKRTRRDIGTLVSGNVWAQAAALASYLLLTRLYTPEDFALYNIFYSYIEVLIILSTCKYEMGIVAASTDREAASLARFSMRMNLCVSLIALAALAGAGLLHRTPGGIPLVMALLIPPMVWLCGTSRIYSGLFNRGRRYREIALSGAADATSGALLKVLAALPAWLHPVGLPLGTVLGRAIGNLAYTLRLSKLPFPRDISRSERRQAARLHRNLPLFTAPKDFLNSFSYNLPLIWLAAYFDKAEVGLFALALTFTFRPVNVLNSAFEKVLYERVAERVRLGLPVWSRIRRFILLVGGLSLPLFAAAFLFADPLFAFFFGGRWAGCGCYVRCLLPWVWIMLVSTSLMFVPNVFGRQKGEFGFYLLLLVLRLLSMAAGLLASSYRLAVLLFGLSGALVSALLLVWYASLLRRHDRSLL